MTFTSDFRENKPKVADNKQIGQQHALFYPPADRLIMFLLSQPNHSLLLGRRTFPASTMVKSNHFSPVCATRSCSMHRVLAWFWFWFLMSSPSLAQTTRTAELGQTVILPCKAANSDNKTIKGVQWSRPDQNQDYVLLFRDGKFIPEHQNPSYQDRVDLQDKDMKDGDASLVLKDVIMEDTGTYECRVLQKGNNEPISIILEVLPPGDKDGTTGDGGHQDGTTGDGGHNTGIILGPVVGVLLPVVLLCVGFLMWRKLKVCKKLKRISRKLMRQNSTSPPVTPDGGAAEQLMKP